MTSVIRITISFTFAVRNYNSEFLLIFRTIFPDICITQKLCVTHRNLLPVKYSTITLIFKAA